MLRLARLTGTAVTAALVAALASPLGAATPPTAPPPSELPRLRRLWSMRGVLALAPPFVGPRSVHAGTVLVFEHQPEPALMGIELHTGRQRWRIRMPNESPPEVVLAGELALLYRAIGVTAIELPTGKPRWTSRLCRFQGDPETAGQPAVGVGLCTAANPAAPDGDRPRLVWGQTMAVAIDLATGEELWRLPTGWPRVAPAASGGVVYVASDTNERRSTVVTVSALEPRSGKALRRFPLSQLASRIYPVPADPGRALFVGENHDIVAVNLGDGRVLWRRPPRPPSAPSGTPAIPPELWEGRLIAGYGNHIAEIDLRSGQDLFSWDIPDTFPVSDPQKVRPTPDGGLLVIKRRPTREPAVALRFARSPAPAAMAVLPTEFDDIVAIEDGVVLVYRVNTVVVEAYAAFETSAAAHEKPAF